MKTEDQLYKSCIGYYVDEIKAFKCQEIYYDESGRECSKEIINKVAIKTYIKPDILAIMFWLGSRQPDKWKIDKNIMEYLKNNI